MSAPWRHRPIRNALTHRAAFTLLEVLAAVAILSIWFIVIAGTAMQGLRAEGVSRRRLEAGMLADRALSDLEAAANVGTVPEPMEELTPHGDYTLSVIVSPFQGADPNAAAIPVDVPAPDGAIATPPLDQLIASELPERSLNLRRIDVRVSWLEGAGEEWVDRTTFVFDLVAAQQAYEQAGISSSEPATPTDEQATDTPATRETLPEEGEEP